eukprot:363881-Chlamydomonas_euryale.AAC.4
MFADLLRCKGAPPTLDHEALNGACACQMACQHWPRHVRHETLMEAQVLGTCAGSPAAGLRPLNSNGP